MQNFYFKTLLVIIKTYLKSFGNIAKMAAYFAYYFEYILDKY